MAAKISTIERLADIAVPYFPTMPKAAAGLVKLALTLRELREAAAVVDPEPSEAQKVVGNYAKGHVFWKGLDLTIETAKGQYRRGTSSDGKAWSTLMKDHYGYIKNTLSEADGDHIDIFLCEDDLDSEIVFIVNQVDPDSGKFDEHKVVLGVSSREAAERVYLRNYEPGWKGMGEVTPVTLTQFEWWLEHADTSKAIADGYFAKHRRTKTAADLPAATFQEHVTYDPVCPHCHEVMPERHYAIDYDPETKKTGEGWRHRGKCFDKGPFTIDWPNKVELPDWLCHKAASGDMLAFKAWKATGLSDEEADRKAGESLQLPGDEEDELIEDQEAKTTFDKQAELLPDVKLRPHQEEVAESAEEPEKRMLLYHALGSGKSLTSLAAAESAGDPYTAVAPASLRPNYRKEQEKFTDMATPSNLVSYNAVAKGDVPATDTLIFDEAQRLRNLNSATTQNAIRLADKAKHVYLLSGTPVVNHPHDLVPMIRMLTGKEYTPETFDEQFVDERKISPGFFGWLRGVKPVTRPEMKNKEEFEKLLAGHVHHFAPDKPAVEEKDEHYTTEMSPDQTRLYQGFWDQLPWLMRWKMQNDYPMTRQEMTRLSSFVAGPRQVSLSTYPFMRGKADPWKAYKQSPKLQKAVGLMREALAQDPQARGVAYSNFIDAGLTPYGAALDRAKIPYGVFHGGLNDAARKKVVDDYNAGRIRALLLGPSGGEGISLKGTRLLQILDPHWNSARSEQAVGRGIRYDSHSDLPIQDRNVRVQRFVSHMPKTMWQKVWRTLWRSKANDADPRRQSPGVDTYLENLAANKDELNEQFLEVLRQVGTKQAADAVRDTEVQADDVHPFTIAVDLDGTLAEKEEPFDAASIGAPRPGAREWMRRFRKAGARLIIFTVRGTNELVRDWLQEHDIPFDFINENPDQPPDSSGKVFADVYWDDKAISAAAGLASGGKQILTLMKAGACVVRSDEPELLDAIIYGLQSYFAQ